MNNSLKSTISLFLCFIAICACTPAQKQTTRDRLFYDKSVHSESYPLGISIIEPKSDVAVLSLDRRHVIGPDNSLELLDMQGAVTHPAKQSDHDSTIHETQVTANREDGTYQKAWDKECEGKVLTAKEQEVVDSTQPPNNWERDCRSTK